MDHKRYFSGSIFFPSFSQDLFCKRVLLGVFQVPYQRPGAPDSLQQLADMHSAHSVIEYTMRSMWKLLLIMDNYRNANLPPIIYSDLRIKTYRALFIEDNFSTKTPVMKLYCRGPGQSVLYSVVSMYVSVYLSFHYNYIVLCKTLIELW